MKNLLIFLICLLFFTLGGVYVYLEYKSLPNIEAKANELNADLLQIENANTRLNELLLRSRANMDTNYDMLVRASAEIESLLDNLEEGFLTGEADENSVFSNRLKTLRTAFINKFDSVEKFKTNNSVLRNSERYAPEIGQELASLASSSGQPAVSKLYSDAVFDLQNFSRQASNIEPTKLKQMAVQLRETAGLMPEYLEIEIAQFATHVETVASVKPRTDRYLSVALNSALNKTDSVASSWVPLGSQNQAHTNFNLLRVFYLIALTLFFLITTALVFRRIHKLNQHSRNQSGETLAANLKVSDLQESSIRNEDLALLGQRVRHNQPELSSFISQIRTGLESLDSGLSDLLKVHGNAVYISSHAQSKSPDKATISALLREQIRLVRSTNTDSSETIKVLQDTQRNAREASDLITNVIMEPASSELS